MDVVSPLVGLFNDDIVGVNEVVGVIVGATQQSVSVAVGAAPQGVVAGTPVKVVSAGASVEAVVAPVAPNLVVTGAACNVIAAVIAEHKVCRAGTKFNSGASVRAIDENNSRTHAANCGNALGDRLDKRSVSIFFGKG